MSHEKRTVNMMWQVVRRIGTLVCCLGLAGCGGGSQGTGGVTIEGRVLELAGAPIGGMEVTVVESGDSTLSDASGAFAIAAPAGPQIGLIFEQGPLSVQTTLANVPAGTKVVRANFEIDRDKRSVKERDVSFSSENESSSGDGDDDPISGPSTDDNGDDSDDSSDDDSSDSDGSEDDGSDDSEGDDSDDEGDDDRGNNSEEGEPNGGEENEGDGSSGGGAGEGSGSEGRNQDARGQISALSGNGVVVNGITFVPDDETEYRNREGERGSLADFGVGDRVRARGSIQNGVVVLERLEFEDD